MDENHPHILLPTALAMPVPQHIVDLAGYGVRSLLRALATKEDPQDRFTLLFAVAVATAQGSPAEREHAHELKALSGRILAGDAAAVEAALAWADRHSPEVVAEPPAEARSIAATQTCEEILDALASPGHSRARRVALVQGLAIRSGVDRSEYADPTCADQLVPHVRGLVEGSPRALAAARAWVAEHVKSPAPWESSR